MRAVLHTEYGPPDRLRVVEVEKPVPADDQLLVRVHASTVSTGDCNVRNMTFVPPSMMPIARLMFGVGKPRKPMILGTQLAGAVESVGATVTRFNVGDRVFASTGGAGGGHAEYACVAEGGAVARIPEGLGYEDAAAIPFGADTALYYLRDLANLRPRQELLVIGASGGVGSAAVQIAKDIGARVTGVCSTPNLELVRSLGADEVVDYTREDVTANGRRYDAILDTAGPADFTRYRGSLKSAGVYLPLLMNLTDLAFRMPWTALGKGPRLKGGVALENHARMQAIAELIRSGRLRAVVDRVYPLDRIAEAFAHVERGHTRGSVVVRVASATAPGAAVADRATAEMATA